MKGDKVYAFVENYNFDYESETKVTLFEDKQDAYDRLAEVKDREIKGSWISRYDEDDLEVGYDDYDGYDIYLQGYAAQYETNLRVVELRIH